MTDYKLGIPSVEANKHIFTLSKKFHRPPDRFRGPIYD